MILPGKDILGLHTAVTIDWVLWTAGTVTGLPAVAGLRYLTFTRHDIRADSAFGGWLMPVMPPLVAASTGALLLPYIAAGPVQLTLLTARYTMFGLSLCAPIFITLIWDRLVMHAAGEARRVGRPRDQMPTRGSDRPSERDHDRFRHPRPPYAGATVRRGHQPRAAA